MFCQGRSKSDGMVQVGLEVNNRIDDNLYAGGAAGTSTSAILLWCNGTPTYGAFANTEEWNGSNWSEGTDLITACYAGGFQPAIQ